MSDFDWQGSLRFHNKMQQVSITVGSQEVRASSLSNRNHLNDRPLLSFDFPASTQPPIDFLAPVQVQRVQSRLDGTQVVKPMFAGLTDRATHNEGLFTVTAISGTELGESLVPGLAVADADARDVVYGLARTVGMTDDQISIHGFDEIPTEVFQVAMPVDGVETRKSRLSVNNVQFLVNDQLRTIFANLGQNDIKLCAVTYVTAKTLYGAEAVGMQQIHNILDRLLAVAVYGGSSRPGGHPLNFQRERVRARPRARQAVHVMGCLTGRRWCRVPRAMQAEGTLSADKALEDWPEVENSTDGVLANAFAALRRVADSTAPAVERVQALWNSLEFYAANAVVPRLFSKKELKLIRYSISQLELSDDQKTRAADIVCQQLNSPPLFTKIISQARADGVPLSQSEISLLSELRASRNSAAHGRGHDGLDEQRLAWAVSITARLLLYRHVRAVAAPPQAGQL